MNFLVTGGAGFIGSYLVKILVEKGHKIKVIDNLIRSNTKNIQKFIDDKKIEFIKEDIRNEKLLNEIMKDVDVVFHMAAVCINYSLKFPKESLDINLIGSDNIFKAALENNSKVVFSSSASVYGDPKRLPINENDELNPMTPYCIAKMACEKLLKFYGIKGLKYNVLRYFNVYGLRQNIDAYYTSVIIKFIHNIINNKSPVIQGDGNQSMDFVNVKDIVKANIMVMESDVNGEIFNVGTGISTTIKDLAEILIKSLGKDIKPVFEGRSVFAKERKADISKIKKIGFNPSIQVKEGIGEVAKDIYNNPGEY